MNNLAKDASCRYFYTQYHMLKNFALFFKAISPHVKELINGILYDQQSRMWRKNKLSKFCFWICNALFAGLNSLTIGAHAGINNINICISLLDLHI